MLVDAHPKLVDIHARCGHADVKQLSPRRRSEREAPLLISLRGLEHCLPVGATKFNCYPACRFTCSPNKNTTSHCMAYGDFLLSDKLGRVPGRYGEEENRRQQCELMRNSHGHFLVIMGVRSRLRAPRFNHSSHKKPPKGEHPPANKSKEAIANNRQDLLIAFEIPVAGKHLPAAAARDRAYQHVRHRTCDSARAA